MCGIGIPEHVQGRSIRPLLADPKSTWRSPAITTFGRNNHAVRTEEWRLIRYADGGEELYDETNDPYEWTNLADDPRHAEQKARLAAMLPKQNVSSQPNATERRAGRNKQRRRTSNEK